MFSSASIIFMGLKRTKMNQKNGNIAAMQWNVVNESGNRAYSFTYDGLNRQTDAIYNGLNAKNVRLDMS